MTRKQEFEEIKRLIEEYYEDGHCGLFNTKNIVGDYMMTLFGGKYLQLDFCYNYSYFEVFGTTKKEWKELEKFYDDLREKEDR